MRAGRQILRKVATQKMVSVAQAMSAGRARNRKSAKKFLVTLRMKWRGSFGPAEADEIGTEGDALAVSGALDLDAQADVFDDLHAEGLESADGAVDIGADRD